MALKGSLRNASFLSKSLVFLGVCLLVTGIFVILSQYLAQLLFKIDLLEENLINHISHARKNQNVINAYKLAQGLQSLALFILSPLICAYLFFEKPSEFLATSRYPKFKLIIALFLTLLASSPVINFLLSINEQMQFPDWLHSVEIWMQESEKQAAILTEAILSTTSVNGLISNIIIVALFAAVGEEIMFRGIIQQGMQRALRNKHVAVVISAALFSALHMQFFGFLPRFALGIILGYAFLWSGSLWVSIAGHFFNNASVVILTFFAKKNNLPINPDTIGTEKGDFSILIISLILTGAGLYYLKKNEVKQDEMKDLSA